MSTKHVDKNGWEHEVFDLRENKDRGGFETGIEVVDKNGEWLAEIGIWTTEDKDLDDYDGVFELNMGTIEALRKAGITVDESFEP
tara:strand:- start:4880 stop:5134 length:255 start_codon:yes stop_codon:yes gene_type:complete